MTYKVIVDTQYAENYGEGSADAHWKFKGGNSIFAGWLTREELRSNPRAHLDLANEIRDSIEHQNDGSAEFIVGVRLERA